MGIMGISTTAHADFLRGVQVLTLLFAHSVIQDRGLRRGAEYSTVRYKKNARGHP